MHGNGQFWPAVVPEFLHGHGRMCIMSISFQCFQGAEKCEIIVISARLVPEFSHDYEVMHTVSTSLQWVQFSKICVKIVISACLQFAELCMISAGCRAGISTWLWKNVPKKY
jgi:hypothetical protein